MDPQVRRATITEKFEQIYGCLPSLWARAPGRVDLMGSHTDYNLGCVMTMTLDRDTWLAVHPRSDRKISIASLNVEGRGEFSLDHIQSDPAYAWIDYVRGTAKILQGEGYPLAGFDGLIHSTIPFGSGLSSSAAIEMAVGAALQLAGGFQVDPVQMALLGQRAENQFVGVNCGILDQYSSALGKAGCALLLDCARLSSRDVPIAAGLQVVICDTRAERNLIGSEYGERRAQCEEGVRLLKAFYPPINALCELSCEQFARHEGDLPAVVARRCKFIIEENQRVLDLGAALTRGDKSLLRGLMDASYSGARDLYEIGSPAMQAMWQAMTAAPGVIGARQAGAGFGGCMVALVQATALDAFSASVMEQYAIQTGIEPCVFPVTASPGAGPL